MSVHKTKAGTYQVRWRINEKMKSRNFDRKIDAEKFDALQKINDAPAAQRLHEDLASRITFIDFTEIWMRDYGQVHKTESSLIRDHQMIRDYLAPHLGGIALTAIARRDLVALQGTLKSSTNLSSKSINNVVGLAKKIFKCAAEWEYIKSNPATHIKPIKLPEPDFKFWTFAERDRFLSWAKVNDPDLYDIVAFAVYTGLRRGEVEGLLRDCLDFERGFIVVKRAFCDKTKKLNLYTKGKRIRRVPMNPLVTSVLRRKSLIPFNGQVFPFDYHNMTEGRFKRAQKLAGVSRITFHDLRHTCASHLAMLGVSIFIIKELLGHKDIKTTLRYMHLAPGHLAGVTDQLLPKEELQAFIGIQRLEDLKDLSWESEENEEEENEMFTKSSLYDIPGKIKNPEALQQLGLIG